MISSGEATPFKNHIVKDGNRILYFTTEPPLFQRLWWSWFDTIICSFVHVIFLFAIKGNSHIPYVFLQRSQASFVKLASIPLVPIFMLWLGHKREEFGDRILLLNRKRKIKSKVNMFIFPEISLFNIFILLIIVWSKRLAHSWTFLTFTPAKNVLRNKDRESRGAWKNS